MEKSTQIFIIIKYQKNALNVFAYQLYYSIQFIKKTETIVLKCF